MSQTTTPEVMSKAEFAALCKVSPGKAKRWFNVDYYNDLVKLGYKKTQHIFTPAQTSFLLNNIVECKSS